jgi:hypothetical protein
LPLDGQNRTSKASDSYPFVTSIRLGHVVTGFSGKFDDKSRYQGLHLGRFAT